MHTPDNHFHFVLYVPSLADMPADEAIAQRHNNQDSGRKNKVRDDDEEECDKVRHNMRNISHFMRDFQQRFTRRFNAAHDRRGGLWADRFKNSILQEGNALWDAVSYVELNPVRAGLVDDPTDYRFGTLGVFQQEKSHPFKQYFARHLRRWKGSIADGLSDKEMIRLFKKHLEEIIQEETKGEIIRRDQERADNNRPQRESEALRFLTRTREWSHGLIIGTRAFIIETASRIFGTERAESKQLSRKVSFKDTVVHCFKRLRQDS